MWKPADAGTFAIKRKQYSIIIDQELDNLVSQIQHQFPTCGNQQMQAHLLSRGLRLQQLRIRESRRRVDPEESLLRRLNGIFRREYVPAPRSLYHIDGNHKLIRYARHITLFYHLGIKSTTPYCFSIKPQHTGFYKIIHCGEVIHEKGPLLLLVKILWALSHISL